MKTPTMCRDWTYRRFAKVLKLSSDRATVVDRGPPARIAAAGSRRRGG